MMLYVSYISKQEKNKIKKNFKDAVMNFLR